MLLNWNVSSRKKMEGFKMGKFNFNAAVKDICNKVNALINEQEMKYYVKKGGEWKTADDLDLLFFNKSEFVDILPRKRGDLMQTNTWQGFILAVFIGNKNNKDEHYTIAQLNEAERMAPAWLQENSNLVA